MSAPPTPTGLEWVARSTLERWEADAQIELLGPQISALRADGRHRLTRMLPGDARRPGFDLRAQLSDGAQATLTVTMPARRLQSMLQAAFADQRSFILYGLDFAPARAWAGVRAMPALTEQLEAFAYQGAKAAGGQLDELIGEQMAQTLATTTMTGVSLMAVQQLRHATPIVADPETMAGLPSFEDLEEAFAYGAMMALPFPTCFVDLCGVDGQGTIVELEALAGQLAEFELLGALVSRSHDGGVAIMPFARNRQSDGLAMPEVFGRVVFGVDSPAPLGMEPLDVPVPAWDDPLRVGVLSPGSALMLGAGGPQRPGPFGDEMLDRMAKALTGVVRGRVELAGTVDMKALTGDEDADVDEHPGLMARCLVALACEVLGIFYFLDVPGTELTAVPMARAERRRAERENRPVAQTVRLVPRARAAADLQPGAAPDAKKRQLTVRFVVRGTIAHYRRGTRMADADPDLIRPCPRCGECRRVLRPPFWKGPEGAPVKLKTRVLSLRSRQQAAASDTSTAA